MKTLLVTLASSLALTSCLAASGTSGTTGGNGVCRSAGESCTSSADCCSGFACSGTTCVFTGGNGNNNGSGGSSGASTTGASNTSANGTTGSSATSGGTGSTHATTGNSTGSHSTGATTGHATGSSEGSSGGNGSSSFGNSGGNGSSSFGNSGGNGSSSFGNSGGNGSSSFGNSGGNGSSSFGGTGNSGGNGSSSFGNSGGNGSSSFGNSGGNGSSSIGSTTGGGSSVSTSAGTSGGSTGSAGNLTPQPLMAGGWPKWQADIANSGHSNTDTSRLAGTIDWTYAVGAAGTSAITGGPDTYANSPVVAADGTIYQVTMAGALVALSPAGTLLWSVQLTDTSGDPYPSTPAIRADGSLVVLTGSDYPNATAVTQQLFVVSSTGVVLFSESYGEDGFDAPPTISGNGTLFLTDDDGSGATSDLYSAMAYTVQNGNLALYAGANFAFGTDGQSERYSVALTSETSYWADNGQYFALTSPTAGFAVAAPWPAAGVTVTNGNADPDNITGSSILGGAGLSNSSVAIDPVTGYVVAYTGWEDGTLATSAPFSVLGSLTALDPSSGAVKWTLALPTTTLPATWTNPLESDSGNAAPAFASDGTVYIGAGNGLMSVNGTTGAVNWTFASANVSSSIAVGGDGTVFFGCDDGSFYAVTAAGAQRFKIATGATISSGPAIGPNGNVYFVSDNGSLYAIH